MKQVILLALVALLPACQRPCLTARSEYLYPEHLASNHIGTPDPCRFCYYGQQVIVSWHLAQKCCPDLLQLDVRYGNRCTDTITWPVHLSQGYRIYRLINDEYWCRDGIVSFKATLYRDGEILTSWTHHLWADVIEFD